MGDGLTWQPLALPVWTDAAEVDFCPHGTIFLSFYCGCRRLYCRGILLIGKCQGSPPNHKGVWWVEDTGGMGGLTPPLGAQQAPQSSPGSSNAVDSVDFLAIPKTPGPNAPLGCKVVTLRKPWLCSRCGRKKGNGSRGGRMDWAHFSWPPRSCGQCIHIVSW